MEFSDLLVDVQDDGTVGDEQYNRVFYTEFVILAHDRGSGDIVWVVAEVSSTLGENDITRAEAGGLGTWGLVRVASRSVRRPKHLHYRTGVGDGLGVGAQAAVVERRRGDVLQALFRNVCLPQRPGQSKLPA